MTESFLILLDSDGCVKFYLIENADEAPLVMQHRGENQIVRVFPNKKGSRAVCIDATGNGYLYNPIDDTQLMIPNFSGDGVYAVLYDLNDRNMFVTVDAEKL